MNIVNIWWVALDKLMNEWMMEGMWRGGGDTKEEYRAERTSEDATYSEVKEILCW